MDKEKYFKIISNIPKGYEIDFLESEMKIAERDFFCKPETFIRELTQAIDERRRDIILKTAKKRSELKHEIETVGEISDDSPYHQGDYHRDVRFKDETEVYTRKAISYDEYHKRETERRITNYKSQLEKVINDALYSIMVLNNHQSKVDELQGHPKPDSSVKDNNEKEKHEVEKYEYEVDTGLVHVIFNFCKVRSILKDEITELKLMNRFAQADFSGDIHTGRNKLKIQIIIHAFVTEGGMKAKTDEWYTDAVNNLGITKSECSKSVSPEFKDELISAIKEYRKG